MITMTYLDGAGIGTGSAGARTPWAMTGAAAAGITTPGERLLRGRTAGRYNWLADHDFFGLPKVRDFVAAQGERRFFLHLLTVSSHHPYGGEREGRGGRHLVTCPSLSERESAYSTMARTPVSTGG